MKLTTRKTSSTLRGETMHVIEREGVPVGLLTKLRDTPAEEHPWKLFLYRGEFVPARTSARLVTTSYGKRWPEARAELLRIAARELQRGEEI